MGSVSGSSASNGAGGGMNGASGVGGNTHSHGSDGASTARSAQGDDGARAAQSGQPAQSDPSAPSSPNTASVADSAQTQTRAQAAAPDETASPLAHFTSEAPAPVSLTPQQIASLPASFTATTPGALAALAAAAPQPADAFKAPPAPKPVDFSNVPSFAQTFNADTRAYTGTLTAKGVLGAGDETSLTLKVHDLGSPFAAKPGTERADIGLSYKAPGLELGAGIVDALSPQYDFTANAAMIGNGWKVEAKGNLDRSGNLKGALRGEVTVSDSLKAYTGIDKQESGPANGVAGLRFGTDKAHLVGEVRTDFNGATSGFFGFHLERKF